MAYDKFTSSYFNDLPSRKRLEHDFDYLQNHQPDLLYHYSFGLYRLVVVRNINSKGDRSTYSLKALGYPPSVGYWRTLFNSNVLNAVLLRFCDEVKKHVESAFLCPKGDWNVSEL